MKDTSMTTMHISRISGDIASLAIHTLFRFNRDTLRYVSSEARFADKNCQFLMVCENGVWYIEGNPNALNLTAVNRRALPTGRVTLRPGDRIELLGRKSGRYAMCLLFELERAPAVPSPRRPSEKPAVLPGATKPIAQTSNASGWNTRPFIIGFSADEVELQKIIASGWKSFAREIDITEFVRRTHWKSDKIFACARHAYLSHPEIFYFTYGMTLRELARTDGHLVKCVMAGMKYELGASEYHLHKPKLDAAIAAGMSCIKGVSDEVEKALRLHDYLVRVCDYDVAAKDANDSTCIPRTAYSALVRKKAVCEGYAMAYRYLLNAAGIVSDVAESDSIRHIWNYVLIHGKWYHVDVTWDDPIYIGGPPPDNTISHKHFLMSDKKARATGHKLWDIHGLPAADDERFDSRYN